MFFQTLKRFLTSFSILFNFQGPVRLSLAADDLFIVPPKWFFVKPYFLEAFELSELGHPRSFSEQTGTFQRLLVLFKGFLLGLRKSFFCLSAWRSSIIPHPRLLVNTFWQIFSSFFCVHPKTTAGRRKNCAAALAADDLIILPQKRFFVKHFFEKLLKFFELGAL